MAVKHPHVRSVCMLTWIVCCLSVIGGSVAAEANPGYRVMSDPNNNNGLGHEDGEYMVMTDTGNVTAEHPCHLHPYDTKIHARIAELHEDGAKLLTYNLRMGEYDVNPLRTNMSWYYHAHKWQRTFDSHGRTLLTLAFNYDVLSLLMLTFGTETLDVELVDAPPKCFAHLTEDEKLAALRDLLTTDFRVHEDPDTDLSIPGDDAHVCHEVIVDEDGRGEFKFRCCRRREEDDLIECTDNDTGTWILMLYILIIGMKLFALLFGPHFLQWLFHSESIRTTDYVIKLKEKLQKTILVKKVKDADDSGGKHKEMRQFKKFRRLVKAIPSEEIVPVTFEKLQIQVDQRRLMSQKSVPVGLFHFLYENLFRCRLRRWQIFGSCCQESIFGSWSPYFLWLRLKKSSECNTNCRTFLSWGHVFVLLGGLLTLAAIPFPYYIRVGIYVGFEQDEIDDRRVAVEKIGLKREYDHNLLHIVSPTHAGMILVYLTYLLTFLILAAFRECNAEKFDEIAVTAVQDMKHIRRSECLGLITAHLILPFEKFGLCGGLLVGAVYWPLALPFCLLVGFAYGIPTIYLTGRFLIHSRPAFLYLKPIPTTPLRCDHRPKPLAKRNISDGTSSFETCLLLENISPRNDLDARGDTGVCCRCRIDKHRLYTACLSWIIGLLCICFMYSVLVMFAEVFGFVIEVAVFTLMGAIVNAGIAARYVMLAFWVIMYSTACYNQVYENYMALNKNLFSCIKSRLGNDIREVTLLREAKQKNTAFKYFSTAELRDQAEAEMELEIDSDDDLDEQTTMIKREEKMMLPSDSIEYVKDKLHWRINTLVFFVDSKDEPRIPKQLFEQICLIRAPGCPGPIYLSLLQATRQLFFMILFLLFVLIVVMSFGDIYNISTTNQLLVTLAGGFVPWVVRFVIQPKRKSIELGTYSFEGKIHHIIRTFNQSWPVFDMSFTKTDGCQDDPSGGTGDGAQARGDRPDDGTEGDNTATLLLPGRQPKKDPTHVDLLITIRDDCDYVCDGANLRSEPVSHGSRTSLTSANRPSPEEVNLVGLNNPQTSNALRRTMATPSDAPNYSNESRRRAPGPTASTQTDRCQPSSFGQTSPCNRPVDLMVDMVKGNVRVRNADAPTDSGNGAAGNTSPHWTHDSPYNRMAAQDESESSV